MKENPFYFYFQIHFLIRNTYTFAILYLTNIVYFDIRIFFVIKFLVMILYSMIFEYKPKKYKQNFNNIIIIHFFDFYSERCNFDNCHTLQLFIILTIVY